MQLRFITSALAGLCFGYFVTQGLGCSSQPTKNSEASSTANNRRPASDDSQARASGGDDSSNSGAGIADIEKSGVAYFQWPVDQARLSRGFNPRLKKPHWGIDLAAPRGTPILAAHDGVVIYTGREFKGFGKMVMIEGGKGWATLYAHFSKITAREGQRVRRGDVIGQMGRTGHATGNHLHFEVRSEQGPVDPLDYLPNGSAVAKISAKHSR